MEGVGRRGGASQQKRLLPEVIATARGTPVSNHVVWAGPRLTTLIGLTNGLSAEFRSNHVKWAGGSSYHAIYWAEKNTWAELCRVWAMG
jgi:hypothetical protein